MGVFFKKVWKISLFYTFFSNFDLFFSYLLFFFFWVHIALSQGKLQLCFQTLEQALTRKSVLVCKETLIDYSSLIEWLEYQFIKNNDISEAWYSVFKQFDWYSLKFHALSGKHMVYRKLIWVAFVLFLWVSLYLKKIEQRILYKCFSQVGWYL